MNLGLEWLCNEVRDTSDVNETASTRLNSAAVSILSTDYDSSSSSCWELSNFYWKNTSGPVWSGDLRFLQNG